MAPTPADGDARPDPIVWKAWIGAVVVLLLLVTTAVATVNVREALEERRAAEAATELRLAVSIVATADAVALAGGEPHLNELRPAVDHLQAAGPASLRALDRAEAAEARELLADIVGCGVLILNRDPGEHPVHDHRGLAELLSGASQRASADADRAEETAGLSLVGAVLALLFGGFSLLRSRSESDRRRARAKAEAAAGRRLQSLINDSPEMFVVADHDGLITYRSASADRLLDPAAEDCRALITRAAPGDRRDLERHLCESADGAGVFELTDQAGASGWFQIRVSDLTDDVEVGGHVTTIREITGEIELREELRAQANTDSLTGLPNRRVLSSALDAAASGLRRAGGRASLMIIDIDGFKQINDTFGHLAGDAALVQVGQRLASALEDDEILIRLGGDEFAVLSRSSGESEDAILGPAQRMATALERPLTLSERSVCVRGSIGITSTSDPGHVGEMLPEADAALYEAKHHPDRSAVAFEPGLRSPTARNAEIVQALRLADHDAEFSLVYQPIVGAADQRIVGLEALLRWNSPTIGEIGPAEFIPVAETTGEIFAIGRWVFDKVCEQVSEWTRRGIDPNVTVSLNVSAAQLAADDFPAAAAACAAEHGVSPDRLVLEVTETAALDPTGGGARQIGQLKRRGFHVSIDDFGSGYSNLGQLLQLPFDVIKIDRSLLLTLSSMREGAGGDPTEACAIMSSIASIASIMGAPVVCEGVETEQQRASLAASGIDFVQGYLTGRPMPAAVAGDLVCSAGAVASTV